MRIAHFFIERPRFAIVVSGFLTLIGLGVMLVLPVAQYPEIVPPTVQITTSYPGASAETIARTIATPLEQQINGVENMLYMNSQSTGDGNFALTVTFRIGTDLNVAQMLTQKSATRRPHTAAGRRSAPRRPCEKDNAQYSCRHPLLFPGSVPRSALPLQLRHPPRQGCIGSIAWSG